MTEKIEDLNDKTLIYLKQIAKFLKTVETEIGETQKFIEIYDNKLITSEQIRRFVYKFSEGELDFVANDTQNLEGIINGDIHNFVGKLSDRLNMERLVNEDLISILKNITQILDHVKKIQEAKLSKTVDYFLPVYMALHAYKGALTIEEDIKYLTDIIYISTTSKKNITVINGLVYSLKRLVFNYLTNEELTYDEIIGNKQLKVLFTKLSAEKKQLDNLINSKDICYIRNQLDYLSNLKFLINGIRETPPFNSTYNKIDLEKLVDLFDSIQVAINTYFPSQ